MITIHRALLNHYREHLSNPAELSSKLIQSLSSDAFAWPNTSGRQFYIADLLAAVAHAKARELLSDYGWLKAKLERTDVHALLKDFSIVPGKTRFLQLLHNAIRMSYPALVLDKETLPLELYQRLRNHLQELPDNFLASLQKALQSRPCLPIRTDIHPVGNSIYTIDQPAKINRLITWEDKVIVGLYSGEINVFWIITGEFLFSLVGHTRYIEDFVLAGNVLVSGSWDDSIRTWDLITEQPIHTFTGETAPSKVLATSGNILVSNGYNINKNNGSWDGILKSRDLKTGMAIKNLLWLTCFHNPASKDSVIAATND